MANLNDAEFREIKYCFSIYAEQDVYVNHYNAVEKKL